MASNDMFIRMVMSGDASPFLKEVVSAESRFKGALSGMSSRAARMELFDKLKEDAKTAAAEFFKLKKEADALRQAIAQSESPGRDMEKMLLATEKALTKAETRMGKTRGSLQDMRHELQAAGVDTKNLAAEQEAMSQRIAAVTQRLNSTRKVDDARQILGVQSAHDVEQQIHQVQAAYQRLVTSGKLSWSEQANAAMAMQQRVTELRGQLAQPIQAGLFSNIKSEVLGTIAAMASLTAAINATKSVLTVGGQYEMLQTQLNNVEKSAVLGAGAMDKLKQMALDTPFGVQGLTQSYTQLKNFGLDPMSGALQAASDQAAKLGGSQETLGRITLARVKPGRKKNCRVRKPCS
ncbi:tape measure protein [Paludibacterium denitrificans]|uniref:tape measure protein n=1 Tax=Paludibacterium denitrificans TaxID=2675226 RepID=UPI002477E460|nr:tape measure protein [Paludibacterium denitrificans]